MRERWDRQGRKGDISPPGWAGVLSRIIVGLGMLATAAGAVPVHLKSPEDNQICLVCHAKMNLTRQLPTGKTVSLHVDPVVYQRSVHAERVCTDCHVDIVELPHEHEIELVNCSRCHYVGNISGAPNLERYEQYQESVHKQALDRGNPKAPTCQDCHGTHNILLPSDPESPMNRRNRPQTCGRCHLKEYSEYQEGIHGWLLREGNTDVPICTDCHGEHNIQSPHDTSSTVYPTHIPETCSQCHAAERLMRKYGISVEQYATYRESYHGIVNQYGGATVANCASCHEAHRILPSDDPASSVHKSNIPRTCGKPECHPGASENFARGKMHVLVTKEEEPILYYVSMGFKILTIGTLCALGGHILLDLFRKIQEHRTAHRKEAVHDEPEEDR